MAHNVDRNGIRARKRWPLGPKKVLVRLRGDNDLEVQQSVNVWDGAHIVVVYQLRETEISLFPDEADKLAKVLAALATRCRLLAAKPIIKRLAARRNPHA